MSIQSVVRWLLPSGTLTILGASRLGIPVL